MIDTNKIKQRMGRVVELFAEDIGSLRTGRATPALIEGVVVTVYGGQKMKLIELGSIAVADARMLTFTPWDQTIIREVGNGIAAANIGLTPVVDGAVIRLALPMLTVEQREDYVKLLGRKLEGARGLIRDERGDERRKLQDAKNDKTVSEDEYKRDEAELQRLTDEYVGKLEDLAKKKELEIRG